MPIPRRRNNLYQKRARLPAGYRRVQTEARGSLLADLNDIICQLNERVAEVAGKYKRSTAWVRSQLFGGGNSGQFVRRELKVRLYDAYVHYKGKELNKDLPVGEKFDICEIKAKIAKERPRYTNRPRSEQELWLAEYQTDREAETREPRVNRKGEQQDAAATLKRVSIDLEGLRSRTGVRAVVIAVRPEVLFSMDPFIFCDQHIEDFFSIVLKKTPEQVARLLELSTVNGLKSVAPPPPKDLTELKDYILVRIQEGLDRILKLRFANTDPPHVQMNYGSYDYEIVARHRVRLVGWTFNDGTVVNPGRLSVAEGRKLYNGLIEKTIFWELVPETEVVTGEKRKRTERSDAREKCGPRKKPRPAAGCKNAAKIKEVVSSSPFPFPSPSPSTSTLDTDNGSD